MKKLLLLALVTIALTSCENETPQFKDMQNWYNPSVPVQTNTEFFQIETFGEYAEVANFDIINVYIDDDNDMVAINYTDGDANFYLYINLETEKYMLVWGTMPLANDYPDAFYSYSGHVDILQDHIEFNISNINIAIQGQSYKEIQVINLID